MSTEAIGAAAPEATIVMDVEQQKEPQSESSKATGLHSPPDSNKMNLDGSDSELSDLDDVEEKLRDTPKAKPAATPEPVSEPVPEPVVEDIGEVLPDHYSGTVPVFRPTMKQFQDFKLFMEKVDRYGMKSGIVKIIPPEEWKRSLPKLDELVKQVRVREPIKQDIMGSNGTYRQVNILHQRSYNLPQWRQLCDQSEHQPPARRGERRANAEKHKPATRSRAAAATSSSAAKKTTKTTAKKRRGGRATRRSTRAAKKDESDDEEERPMTPVSPEVEEEEVHESIEEDPGIKAEECEDDDDAPIVRRMGFTRQSKPKTQSTSARRKYIRREGSAKIDEAAFKDWDYHMDVSDYTPERCEELERIYWKTLTYAPPLYGADLPGTLFDESVKIWNLNKLPNLLDVLGTKVPGVNTAYLYLGMWKATFAWHLEDVDLYSINYLHFGAPKQWYSISQGDARRFESAMKNIWPTEAKACDQFLRHKAFLISPAHLKQHYNITVNKCVSYPGEFVVTYPYGYHSGYNLGYNCAEAVNFALDSWLPMGKIAKKCQCAQAQDSVWVDVYEIERKLRGESTEYEETEDEEEEEEEEEHETGLPSPPASHTVRVKAPRRKRKRKVKENEKDGQPKAKKVRLRLKMQAEPPCCFCPNDIPGAEILPTDDGRKAHRLCALYLPETYIETVDGKEVVANAANIDQARLDLKCLYCRSKKGACFQCSEKKCARSYHATCAPAAGVFIEDQEVPVLGEDGTEYKEQAFEFLCRFHRTKRDKKYDGDALEDNPQIRKAAAALKKNDICQMQYYRDDIFAGVVAENRHDEETLLLDVIPSGDRVEVEWKWLLLPDAADFRLPKASANAIPMPTCRKAQKELNAKRPVDDLPRKDDEFVQGFTWAEFHTCEKIKNPEQVKVDLSKEYQVWHYLGKTSTEAKAQYTEDPAKPLHNHRGNFLQSIPKPKVPAFPAPAAAAAAATPLMRLAPQPTPSSSAKPPSQEAAKPYAYKPRLPVDNFENTFLSQKFAPTNPGQAAAIQPAGFRQLQPQQQLQGPQPNPVQTQPGLQQQRLQPQPGPQLQPRPQKPQQSPLQVMQYQPTSHKKPRTKGPPTNTVYSSDRFAPVGGSNGIPQLPGLTWPPAHMKSGHYSQPQSRDWATTVPMTSSALKNPKAALPADGGAAAQPQFSAYQKYSFFQVHHNRNSSRYRTPYGHWGGFINGYEGNLREFLIQAQKALNGKGKGLIKNIPPSLLQPLQPRISASPAPSQTSQAAQSPLSRLIDPLLQSPSPRTPFSSDARAVDQARRSPYSSPTTVSSCEIKQPGSLPLHPAIRPQYAATRQQDVTANTPQQVWNAPAQNLPIQPPPPPPRLPVQAPVASKSPDRVRHNPSPVPLTPYMMAAIPSVREGSMSTTPIYPPMPTHTNHPPQQAVQVAPAAKGPSSPFLPIDPSLLQTPYTSAAPSQPPASKMQATPPPPPKAEATFRQPSLNYQWTAPAPIQAAAPFSENIDPMLDPMLQQAYQPPPDVEMADLNEAYSATDFPEVPTDSTALVERMMQNLKRASQIGTAQ
ncbi:hypothetical protein QBC46DRAFT_416416 [Diplogelasinospora grovesii]|uniref:[histone H3]-trimethyl-L-lysine(9) demethylase n=1 Tax=Diplogelasinospora grovesii TaxID=303347 RepID=A0AAN6S285_9PEZI|nr:hypothetical protein QBC46DRAFT_416416 [Diplogelasinospora grovesii]